MMQKAWALTVFLLSITLCKGFSQTVYTSDKGGKYHTADCRLSGDASAMSLEKAKKLGKTSCTICKPEVHIKDELTQCSGKTLDGMQCKRMTANKSGKCFQHLPAK